MSARPRRVLLVEDDASLQRFVALALDDLDIELQCCANVDLALQALAERPAQLILTDLMMPGRPGFELIDVLSDQPLLRAGARLVVFSAGLTSPVRERLAGQAAVWRLLSKPCSVAALVQCVEEGVAPVAAPATAIRAALESTDASAADCALQAYFGGNTALYRGFRAACLQQFPSDLNAGDEACAAADAPALRRLAHNLASVLLTLGHPPESMLARQLENMAESSQWAQALPTWQTLRTALASVTNDTNE